MTTSRRWSPWSASRTTSSSVSAPPPRALAVPLLIGAEEVEDPDCFLKMSAWIRDYLSTHDGDLDRFAASFDQNREFWKMFPKLIWALSNRRYARGARSRANPRLTCASRFFGQFLNEHAAGRRAVSRMFVAYASIAGRFVAMDVHRLSAHDPAGSAHGPDLGSPDLLLAYAHLISPEASAPHIGANLKRHYRWAWDEDLAAMTDAFVAHGGTIPHVTELVEGQLRGISRNPKSIDHLASASHAVSRAVTGVVPRFRNGEARHSDEHDRLVREGYRFFHVMSRGLLLIIEKHIPCFSVHSAVSHMTCLSSLFQYALQYEIGPVRELLERRRREHAAIMRKDFPQILSREWKFQILHKLITSSQMQLRVTGVSSMQSELLSLYDKYKPDNHGPIPPILLFFANWIIDSHILDYLVGVGSHPELIGDSYNILGFLIATKTYTSQLTDKTWQTVTESQDPRVVEAIVVVLRKILSLLEYAELLYLCEKLGDIPVESFSPVMRDYCQSLCALLIEKANQDRVPQLDAQPYELCVRLIRESSVLTVAATAAYPNILTFATERLRDLLGRGPPDAARDSIYRTCITDIASNSRTAPGSIVVIGTLLHKHPADLPKMTAEYALTQLLVEDLERATESERRQSATRPSDDDAVSVVRREIIQLIIQHEPATLSPDLGARLWEVLVGRKSIVSEERSMSWQLLNTVAKSQGRNNVFIASCFQDFMPGLPPDCFTTGSLDFVRVAITLWFDEVREDFVAEKRAFDSPALDQLWRLILTAPPSTIDAPAINVLVDTFVNSALICKIPRPMARTIHLALVDRCLKQLQGAASTLQRFGTGASVEPSERMAIVASEEELQKQELIFARSLAVLREFLRAYPTKPQFAPPRSRLSITTAPTAVEGEPVTVKYQVFDGPKAMEITSITLGKQNTAATLFAGLERATGFKNYQVYHGGKAVDPEEIDVCKKLEDLNFTGLLLVRKRDDADGFPDSPNGNKMALELEIAKHFDDLWSYLSMNEKVAQEVCCRCENSHPC